MKSISAKYRYRIAALLIGWMLLCGLMPLMSAMGADTAGAHHAHHQMSGHQSDLATDDEGSGHCCDVLQGYQLPVHYPFMDLLPIAILGSLLWLLAAFFPPQPVLSYSPIPPTGPPLRKRHCVWLD